MSRRRTRFLLSGAAAASFAGLARGHREAERAEEVLERALQEGLGADYRRRIAEAPDPRPDPGSDDGRSPTLRPEVGLRRRYAAVRDLA
ncbi:MAG TPA: hypothetical protein VE575_05510, partial [Acidimicrobiales bacterium]|nr:hypothetical protein [Acidimicrobiales bacterium]